MQGICKRFGATVALDGVDLEVRPGEVMALVGENGAGKSTLMKILSGAVRPDAGGLFIDDEVYAPADPLAGRAAGVSMIYQELNLAPHLSVEANLTLGAERTTAGFIRRAEHRPRMIRALEQLGRPDIRPDTRVGRLSAADRQLVEIARALMTDVKVLVMDEPTSSLGLAEIEHLFEVIDSLRSAGVGIVYISHFLEEVRRVADRVTVLKDGRVVEHGIGANTPIATLVEIMIGRRLPEMFPRTEHVVGEPVLELERVMGTPQPAGVDLVLHRGEVLGLAGLVGAGRTELLRLIFGLDPLRAGRVSVARYAGDKRSPAHRIGQGLGLLSESRQTEGLALGRSIAHNMLLSWLRPFARLGWLDTSAMREATRDWMERLGIRARDPGQPVGQLSGGNQQKVALARLLHQDADVLLLDQPTRGIDVASKAQIYGWVGRLAARGKAVLLVSDDVPELLGICDRIAVMHRGQIAGVRPTAAWTEHEIMAAAISGTPRAA